jgi:multidrug efflux pump subunit AcrA (membrane-fusion protein)
LDAEGQRRIMRPGMTASVDIETGQRRVLDFFLDPVMKYISNGITVH